MTTRDENNVDFDELVFEKRNKFYGAYLLRKKYDEHLLSSLLIGVALMGSVVAIPYLASYFSSKPVKEVVVTDSPPTMISVPFYPSDPPKPKVDLGTRPKTAGGQAATIANRTLVMSDTQGDITPQEDMKGLQPSTSTNPGDGSEIIGDGTENGGDCLDCPENGGNGNETMKVFRPDEAQPKYPGGDEAMYAFLHKNIHYPERAKQMGVEGIVYIQFVVDEYGNIRFSKIARGIGGGCDEEALRVVNMMPRWEPARQAGHPVRVQFHLPISYSLQ